MTSLKHQPAELADVARALLVIAGPSMDTAGDDRFRLAREVLPHLNGPAQIPCGLADIRTSLDLAAECWHVTGESLAACFGEPELNDPRWVATYRERATVWQGEAETAALNLAYQNWRAGQ